MAQLFGLARLGRDAELRAATQTHDAVMNLSLAFSYGRKAQDGKRPTQWVDATFWGKRAESLAQYLLKGSQVVVTLDEVHIETFRRQDNTEGVKLVGKVSEIDLAGGAPGGAPAPAPPPARRAAPPPSRAPAAAPASSGFDDMDDDIPY